MLAHGVLISRVVHARWPISNPIQAAVSRTISSRSSVAVGGLPGLRWECRGDRAEQASVIVCEGGSVVLAAKNAHLVSEHDDLEVLRAAGPESKACQGAEESVEDTKHGTPGWRASGLVSNHARIFGHHFYGYREPRSQQLAICVITTSTFWTMKRTGGSSAVAVSTDLWTPQPRVGAPCLHRLVPK